MLVGQFSMPQARETEKTPGKGEEAWGFRVCDGQPDERSFRHPVKLFVSVERGGLSDSCYLRLTHREGQLFSARVNRGLQFLHNCRKARQSRFFLPPFLPSSLPVPSLPSSLPVPSLPVPSCPVLPALPWTCFSALPFLPRAFLSLPAPLSFPALLRPACSFPLTLPSAFPVPHAHPFSLLFLLASAPASGQPASRSLAHRPPVFLLRPTLR